MLNLLFISSSPKMDFIKKNLQPMLKVKIDVVSDFDHGLKDVFEKRPSTIIIQDQIDGVTGESVARHIQMLLGSGAPFFVVMHEGNARVKPIKGLFEHIVDLTQSDAGLLENILSILKIILGPEWEKITIKPKKNAADLAASFTMSADSNADAALMLDDFLTELGTTENNGQVFPPQPSFEVTEASKEEPLMEELSSDEMARLLVESAQFSSARDMLSDDTMSDEPIMPDVSKEQLSSRQENKISKPRKPAARKTASQAEPSEAAPLLAVSAVAEEVPPAPESVKADLHVSAEPEPAGVEASQPDAAEVALPVDARASNAVPQSPADFRIIPASQELDAQIPEDLLLAFEENYHSQSGVWKRLAIIVVVLIGFGAGGWVLLKQKPGLLSFATSNTKSSPALPSDPVKSSAVSVAQTPVAPQRPVSTAVLKPDNAGAAKLPSFISSARRDLPYSAQNPGWERYIGKVYEYRIFRSGVDIKAVQILAGGASQSVNDKFLLTVLKEFTGSDHYSVVSKDQKQGYLVLRGNVGAKADLLIYRSIKSGGIRGLVVSLN